MWDKGVGGTEDGTLNEVGGQLLPFCACLCDIERVPNARDAQREAPRKNPSVHTQGYPVLIKTHS